MLEKIKIDFKNEIKENNLKIRKEEMLNFGEGLKNLENRIESIETKNFNKEKDKLENLENRKIKSRNKNFKSPKIKFRKRRKNKFIKNKTRRKNLNFPRNEIIK